MNRKTAVIVVTLPFVWWLFLFIDQLARRIDNCTIDDEFCNSANTIWGDLTWSYLIWLFTAPFIMTLTLIVVAIWQEINKRKARKGR